MEDRQDSKKEAGCDEIDNICSLKVWEAKAEGWPQSGCSLGYTTFYPGSEGADHLRREAKTAGEPQSVREQ